MMRAEPKKTMVSSLGLLRRDDARRAEKDDGVFDLVVIEPAFGLQILGENAQRPGRNAGEERLAAVGLYGLAA
jgi:hypothetical protein